MSDHGVSRRDCLAWRLQMLAVAVSAAQTGAWVFCGGSTAVLTILALGGSVLAPMFVHTRDCTDSISSKTNVPWLGLVVGAVCVAGAGWAAVCGNAMGTAERGAGTFLFIGGTAAYSTLMLGVAEGETEGFMLWYGMVLVLGCVSLSAQAAAWMWHPLTEDATTLATWFERVAATVNSGVLCVFYATHACSTRRTQAPDGPGYGAQVELAPLLPPGEEADWV